MLVVTFSMLVVTNKRAARAWTEISRIQKNPDRKNPETCTKFSTEDLGGKDLET
jgi:hypothetical protein